MDMIRHLSPSEIPLQDERCSSGTQVTLHNTMRFDVSFAHVHAAISGGYLQKKEIADAINAAITSACDALFLKSFGTSVVDPFTSAENQTRMLHRETIYYDLS